MEADEAVGKLISARREALGLTQEALAERLGYSAETIRKIEGGQRQPSPKLAKLLAVTLGFPPEMHDWIVLKLRNTVDPARPEIAAPANTPAANDRQRIIEKLRNIWIVGLLTHTFSTHPPIELSLVGRPASVKAPLGEEVQELRSIETPLASATQIGALFDRHGGELLILGRPGAGKTVLLLSLLRDLLDVAARDTARPIPVMLNLSTWSVERGPLAVWLVHELNAQYKIPRATAQSWLDTNQLVALLDGFDEVIASQRVDCLAAINQFRREHGLIPIVVCSREQDYADLAPAQLELQGAVAIQPLTFEQIDTYLTQRERGFGDLRQAIAGSADLRELAQVPLLLAMMIEVVRDAGVAALPIAATKETQRRQLFATYVDRMFKRRTARSHYDRAATMRWLVWLARMQLRHTQKVFLIERLDASWLADARREVRCRAAQVLMFGLIAGLLSGLIWGLNGGIGHDLATPLADNLAGYPRAPSLGALLPWLTQVSGATIVLGALMAVLIWAAVHLAMLASGRLSRPSSSEFHHLSCSVAVGCAVGMIDGPLVGLWNGLPIGPQSLHPLLARVGLGAITALAAGLGAGFVYWHALRPDQVRLVEKLVWSWKRSWGWVALGAAIGFGLGVCYGLSAGLAEGFVMGIAYGLIVGVCAGGVGGLVAGALVGAGRNEIEVRTYPNEGIRRSARTAFQTGILTWLVVGTLAATTNIAALMAAAQTQGQVSPQRLARIAVWSCVTWFVWGLSFGVGAGLLNGGLTVMQHVIVRWMLWREDSIPWRYARFLDAATDRIFLWKIGGGYQFMHPLLREYFASLADQNLADNKRAGLEAFVGSRDEHMEKGADSAEEQP